MTTTPQPVDPKALKSRVRLWTTIAVSLAVLIGIGLLLLPRDPQPVPMPNPNGWNDFMAASLILPQKSPTSDRLSPELKDYVVASQNALQLAREGLQKQTRVPALVGDTNDVLRVNELSQIKRLALAFQAEGRLAQLESRLDDAAKGYLETIQLGQQCGHGGMLIHYMVAIACETIGLRSLESLTPELNARQCRAIATSLETLQASREPFEEILLAEQKLNRSKGFIMELLARKAGNPAIQKTKTNAEKLSTQTQTLQVTLAARAYQLEKGKDPQKYSDLVPDYLKSVPVNPLTRKELDFEVIKKSLQSNSLKSQSQ